MTGREVIALWERALPCGPTERALLMLASATGSGDDDSGLSVSIGARDASILALRRSTFGRYLHGALACPTCSERLAFSLDLDALLETISAGAASAPVVVDDLRFRLPTSEDLLAVERCTDAAAAARLIFDRCRLDPSEPGAWPDATVAAVDTALAAADPGAAIDLAFGCAACAASWSERLDIVSWMWGEIDARAHGLLDDVHVLAAHYGWSEDEILNLGSARRAAYLERCGA